MQAVCDILPPPGSYFIHGLRHWSKSHVDNLVDPEVCVSIQKDGHTVPLRPLGFILLVKNIVAAYDRDAASRLENGERVFSIYSRKLRNYKADELDELLSRTPKGKHNELWVKRDCADIVGGYIVGNGSKSFEKYMGRQGYDIHRIL